MQIDIYTDCAGSEKDYGIGIHMIDQDEEEQSFGLRTNISLICREASLVNDIVGSTAIGEMYSIVKALSLIDNSKFKTVRIYNDNDYCFLILNLLLCKAKSRKIPRMLKLLKSEYFNQIGRFDSVDMMWIKGHVDVYGNNIVDNIAKKMLRSANKNNGGIYTVKYQKGSPLQKLNKVEAKSYEKTDNPDLVAGIDSLFIILKNKGKYAVYIDPWNEFEPSDPSSVEFSGINPELVGKEQFNSLLEVKKALLENEAIEEDAEFIDIKSGDVLVF